jgi:arabinofuranosyltransferase
MHARMLLPALFSCLLPIMTLPRFSSYRLVIGALAAWSIVCASMLRTQYAAIGPQSIENSRMFYINWTDRHHPVTDEVMARAFRHDVHGVNAALSQASKDKSPALVFAYSAHSPTMFWNLIPPYHSAPIYGHPRSSIALVHGAIGQPGALLPLDGTIVDIFGLAYPLAAHLQSDFRVRAGHDKLASLDWILADYTAPSYSPHLAGVDKAGLAAARHVLTCGRVAELQHAVRDPLTVHRFWRNLVGSVGRTELRIPNDPRTAEQEFC